ncbi:hypothetical protein ACJX0J_010592, partial [Zea mays]
MCLEVRVTRNENENKKNNDKKGAVDAANVVVVVVHVTAHAAHGFCDWRNLLHFAAMVRLLLLNFRNGFNAHFYFAFSISAANNQGFIIICQYFFYMIKSL